ncbi:hypothetical protein VSR68_37415 [Paraburkholderia phymatum]|uniref:hypothetical protein n=1 Tax=Paraburkholderia phymatum TaxID=148447 RepID=UPI00317045A2
MPPNHPLFGMVGVFIGICGAATSAVGYVGIVAAQAAVVVGFGLAVARVGIDAVPDRAFAPMVASVFCLAGAADFLVLATGFIRLPGMVMLSALLPGLATGSEGDLIPYLARRNFGTRHLGAIYGGLFGISTLDIGPSAGR